MSASVSGLAALSHLAFVVVLFGVSALLTRLVIGLNISDVPNARSSHDQPTPKSGGVAISAAFLAGMAGIYVTSDLARLPPLQFGAFLALAGVMFAAALLDDLIELRPMIKLTVQLVCAISFSLFVAHVDVLAVPALGNIALGGLGHLLTVLWIIFFMNAFNFMDGINGLAGGGALVSAAFLALIGLLSGAHFVYLSALCLFAAISGFFIFNFPRARIFMGDTGSQTIGFAFAGLAVIGARADLGQISIMVVPALFGCFLFDVVATLLYRFSRGKTLTQAHREHLYQISNRLGFSHARVSLVYFGLFGVSGVFAVLLQFAQPGARLPLLLGELLIFVPLGLIVYGAGLKSGIVEFARKPPDE